MEGGLGLGRGGGLEVVAGWGVEHGVDPAGALLGAQLDGEVGHLATPGLAVLAGWVRSPLESALGVALLALEVELFALPAAEPADRVTVLARHQTLLRLGGRQPLCGIGGTSVMAGASRPAACSEGIARL